MLDRLVKLGSTRPRCQLLESLTFVEKPQFSHGSKMVTTMNQAIKLIPNESVFQDLLNECIGLIVR